MSLSPSVEWWVNGIIPCFEVEEILGLSRRQVMDRVQSGEIPTCGAVGDQPLFDLTQIRGLVPGEQGALF